MKKILIIALSLFVLASCGVKEEIKSTNVVEKKQEIVENNNSEIVDGIIDEKITISDLEKNISKLKDISLNDEDLRMLNEQTIGIFNNSIENEAVKNNDVKVCDKLDKKNLESCKKQVFVKSGKIESCDSLIEDYSKRDCKNTILREEANTNLDENICDKLVFEEQEIIKTEENLIEDTDLLANNEKESEINNCKDRVFEQKAMKNLDSSFCKKLSDNNEVSSCEEIVEMEKENKKMEEESKKQDDLLKIEEDKKVPVPIVENLSSGTGTGDTKIEF